MNYKILKEIPDLMYIKVHNGKYGVYYNYHWNYSLPKTIDFTKQPGGTYPAVFAVFDTYRKAQKTLNEFMYDLDQNLKNGYKARIK